MEDEILNYGNSNAASFSPRDVLTVVFRHRRLMMWCLAGVIVIGVLAALALPKYQAEAKFLIMRERVDPSISPTPEQSTFQMTSVPTVTEEDLNSEVELIDSREILKQVALTTNLRGQKTFMSYLTGWWGWWRSDDEKLEGAIERLDKSLDIETVKRSNIISVTYKNRDPQMAERVLKTLAAIYVQKHMEVHRPSGQYEFFEKQTDRYRQGLQAAEARLKEFPKQFGAVDPQLDRQMTLQKLNDFNAQWQQTRASIKETQDRINDLEQQQKRIPERVTTQLRHSDNPQLLQQMKGTLLDLEIKRVQLLTKYQPDYRPVQEIEKQIADTRATIKNEESAPLRDETTDVDPTFQWIMTELSKAKADLASYQARQTALDRVVHQYQAKAGELDSKSIVLADLQREAKAQEENYLLYQKKREEARITDALDTQRILNVAVAEQPNVPALPKHGPVLWGLLGAIAAMVLSVGLVWTVDHFDTSLHTPDDVEALDVPILSAVPVQKEEELRKGYASALHLSRVEEGYGLYGNRHGNGHGVGSTVNNEDVELDALNRKGRK